MTKIGNKTYYLIAALAFFAIGGGVSAYIGYVSGVDPLMRVTDMPLSNITPGHSVPTSAHSIKSAWNFFIVNGIFTAILVTPIFWMVRTIEDQWEKVSLIIKIPVATLLIVVWIVLVAFIYFAMFAQL